MPETTKTVGRYEVLSEVGRGGMAVVYQARQRHPMRFVALKEMRVLHDSDPSFAKRFLREADLAGSLQHPNIVTVYDYFEFDGTPYIAMEYVERGSLRPYVGHMSLAQIAGVLEGLLAGLAHAELRGVVHRDLKPENLMVTADGRVKIADFGIAKATTKMQTGAFVTATGTTVGTPTYMAPEQAMAQDVGPPTDLYSVGCMAFEMFTGKVPFHDSDAPMAILLRHVNEPIPPVKSIDPNVDAGISDWIEHLLVKDPKQRTQSATEAWDDFEEIIIGLLGPRWRRSARLSERATGDNAPKPLTPAPFEGTSAGAAASEEYQSFAWGPQEAETGATGAAPGPYTPPPQDLPPGPLVAGGAESSGFGTPAPPPPTDALVTPDAPGSAPPEADNAGYETYVEPPPLRPPTGEPERTEPVEAPPAGDSTELAELTPTMAPARAGPGKPETSGAVATSVALPGSTTEADRPHRRRRAPRFMWLIALVVVVAVAAVVALLGRSGGPASTAPPSGQQEGGGPVDVRTSAYRLVLPSGWSVHCRDAAGVCAGERLSDGIRRSAFVLGSGADAIRLTIDRTRVKGTTAESIMSDVVAKLGALPGFRTRSASRSTQVGNRQGRELEFTSRSSLFPAGVVDTVFTRGNAVVIIYTGPTGARARAAGRPVIGTLRF